MIKRSGRTDLVEEIRINPKYTQYFLSEFEGADQRKEATPKIVKRTLFTKDYLKKLSMKHSTISIMPANCRYLEPLSNGHFMIIEEPPALRTITVYRDFHREYDELKSERKLTRYGFKGYDPSCRNHTFTLAFPYVVFLFIFDGANYLSDGRVFLRNQQIVGLSDYLLKAPLYNISGSQQICFGSHANKEPRNSLTEAVQTAIMVFWSAIFNTDYTYNPEDYKKHGSEFGNYLTWQYLSQSNPMFVYDASWIKMGRNLGHYIEHMKTERHLSGSADLNYKRASTVIFGAQYTGQDEKPSKRSRRKVQLFYDIANGMYVGEYFLHLGDPFQFADGRIAYIDSFIGFSDGGRIRYIRVDLNGKKLTMKVTTKVKNYIAVSNKALRYDSETILPHNKLKVKNGDILVMKDNPGGDYYGQIDFIRKARDGESHEIKIGADYYLADQIMAEVFDTSKPVVDGMKLNKKDKYLIVTDPRGPSIMKNGSLMQFEKISVPKATDIQFTFKNIAPSLRGGRHQLKVSSPSKMPRIFSYASSRPFKGVFRVGKQMYFSDSGDGKTPQEGAWEMPAGHGLLSEKNYRLRRPHARLMESLVQNDRFFLEGVHLDLEFNLGDKVVEVNWQNPIEMLKVKEIAGFSFVNSPGGSYDLHFVLSDRDGKLTQKKYLSSNRGRCLIGSVRKITNKFSGVTAGTKIIADASGIHGFPKKNVNIIIGFITDTGGDEPLVLCSNCQTIWFNDMMKNFKRVTMRSKKWKTLDHSPIDLSRIKPQAGDLLNGTSEYKQDSGYLMTHLNDYVNVRAQVLEYYSGFPESYGLDSRFSREYIYEGILNPRLSPKQIQEYGMINGFPNFHGLYYQSPTSDFKFINEPGRILNVSSSPK